jgi:hypothetical protein
MRKEMEVSVGWLVTACFLFILMVTGGVMYEAYYNLTTRPHIHGVITAKSVVERYSGFLQSPRRYYITVTEDDKQQIKLEVNPEFYSRVQSGDRFDRE